MKIRIADSAGFCEGVKEAFNKVLQYSYQYNKKIFTYGSLIHNKKALKFLNKFNIFEKDDIKELSSQDAPVFIRSHGVSPQELRSLKSTGLCIKNATCKRVAYVQATIKKYSGKGYFVVITGKENHPEVRGLCGYASAGYQVINDTLAATDFADKSLNTHKKILLVSQTTFNETNFLKITDYLKEKIYPDITFEIKNTICASTSIRQNEIKELALDCDIMLILGDKLSSNTNKLYDISKEINSETYFIEDTTSLQNINISRKQKIGISAGASTPTWFINEIIDYIKINKNSFFRALLYRLFSNISVININHAFNAFLFSFTACILQNIQYSYIYSITAFFYILGIYNFHNQADLRYLSLTNFKKYKFFNKNQKLMLFLSILFLLLSVCCSFFLTFYSSTPAKLIIWMFYPAFLVIMSIIASILYTLPFDLIKKIKLLPGSKTLFEALIWSLIIIGIPFLAKNQQFYPKINILLYFSFYCIFALTISKITFLDLRAINEDKILNNETIAVFFGKQKMKKILYFLQILLFLLIVSAFFIFKLNPAALIFLIIPIYVNFIIGILYKNKFFNTDVLLFDFWINSISYTTFIVTLLYYFISG